MKHLQGLTEDMVASARELYHTSDGSLMACIQRENGWSDAEVTMAVADLFQCPALDAAQLAAHKPAFDVLSYAECVQRRVLLLAHDTSLLMVTDDPFDLDRENHVHRLCLDGGWDVSQAVAHSSDLTAILSMHEKQMRAMDDMAFEASSVDASQLAAVISLASLSGEESAVVRLVNSTIYDALKLKASDIHLECDVGCLHVLYRIDGALVPIAKVDGRAMAEQVVSRVKVMADLDIAERRVPQDGRFKVGVNGREVDFRVSVMPNIFGEDAVMRLLDRHSLVEDSRSLTLESLGLNGPSIRQIRDLARMPHGMLLLTGPTGSGKTTTLYAAITEVHDGQDKIITIEDPVEYRLPRVLQIPVNEKKGLTFARGLRSILRHDPDKIMVGEIRDSETAQIAVQSALTGHLVFTSVHANGVFDVLGRFMHMGVDPYSLSSALNGVVAQRLVRLNCQHCTEACVPTDEVLGRLDLLQADLTEWRLLRGRGCGQCRGVGYKGRRAVAEVLLLDDALREMVAERAPVSKMKPMARERGWVSTRHQALDWAKNGITSLDEVLRVT